MLDLRADDPVVIFTSDNQDQTLRTSIMSMSKLNVSKNQSQKSAIVQTIALTPGDTFLKLEVTMNGKPEVFKINRESCMTLDALFRLGHWIQNPDKEDELIFKINKDKDAPAAVKKLVELFLVIQLGDDKQNKNFGGKRGTEDDEHLVHILTEAAADTFPFRVMFKCTTAFVTCGSIEDLIAGIDNATKTGQSRVAAVMKTYLKVVARMVEMELAPLELLEHAKAFAATLKTKRPADEPTEVVASPVKRSRKAKK